MSIVFRRTLTIATIVNSTIIGGALVARIPAQVRIIAERRANDRRRCYQTLTLTCRPLARSSLPTVRLGLAPESVCIVLQTQCIASYRAATVIGALDVGSCPIPWTVAIVGEPQDCTPLLSALQFTPNVVLCAGRWLERAKVDVPCGICVDLDGKRTAVPLGDCLPALARLFESCGSADARHWFGKSSVLAQGI